MPDLEYEHSIRHDPAPQASGAKLAPAWYHRKARTMMAKIAVAMVGHHYLHGGKGARPGKQDGAKIRPGLINLEKDKNLPAYFAASCSIDGKHVCGGRYSRLGQAPIASNNAALQAYLRAQDPSRPGGCSTLAGLTPRNVMSGNNSSAGVVWGECCDGWRHFDCIGLIDFCLEQVAPAKADDFRSVKQWASPENTCRALKMKDSDPVLDADLISRSNVVGPYGHIAILYVEEGVPLIVQAEETKVGVTTGKRYTASDWDGGRWRLPDSMFLPDDHVKAITPDSACVPLTGIR